MSGHGETTFALPALPELRAQKVFGRNIQYYDTGRGPPLVLVHASAATPTNGRSRSSRLPSRIA